MARCEIRRPDAADPHGPTVAMVVLRPGSRLAADELTRHLRLRLPASDVPTRFRFSTSGFSTSSSADDAPRPPDP